MEQQRELSLNERRLVERVFRSGGIARIDLARELGMAGASITRLVSGLSEFGLLEESPDRTGAQGQPKRILRVRGEGFLAAGITFSTRRMYVAIINLTGNVLASQALEIETYSAAVVAKVARETVDDMRADLGFPAKSLGGVGFSVPGNFGTSSHLLKAHALFPAFADGEADRAFAAEFSIPHFMENDGAAAALGEYFFGQVGAYSDPLYFLHIGHGVGGGAVVDGRLFRGANGNACLPGFLYPYDKPRPSGQDLLETLANAGAPVEEFDELNNPGSQVRKVLDPWIERAGVQLRLAAQAATGFFDPSEIVVGGRLPDWINQRLVETLLAEPIKGPSRGLKVAPVRASRLGAHGGAVGAACIPLFSRFFSGTVADAGNAYLNGRIRNVSPERIVP